MLMPFLANDEENVFLNGDVVNQQLTNACPLSSLQSQKRLRCGATRSVPSPQQ
jgi:hypothetical protein